MLGKLHRLEWAVESPAIVGRVEVVRRDEDLESMVLRGLEDPLHVLDGPVLLDARADRRPCRALLAQHVVLWVDEDNRGVRPIEALTRLIHRRLPLVRWVSEPSG